MARGRAPQACPQPGIISVRPGASDNLGRVYVIGGATTSNEALRFAPTRSAQVVVEARNSDWTDTGVAVNADDIVAISALGTWCWGGEADCSTAHGTTGRPDPD